ncbi:Gfo/Idh/MocA family oxidoreductase [Schlegelella sp. S2-27]|uniref:Gfo/Idh/MocA family oxidoreductase n=1 Tax=Caldimonas mangrovi TaxID=2944811 RepID=A0ABT0YJ26_9BURK|nr:Gfo/Idh/MocA family oxidoreductase [Caldimonas mangrovi]MCM5678658.1 Gfo/Idh/MocA family oxidoreductase [Caldimonas mangrovi]
MSDTSPSPVRWGLLGAGRITEGALIPALRARGAAIVALGCRDVERGRRLAERHGIDHALPYAELLRRDDIDAVYIGLHNSAHLPWTLAAIEAGKHVLCEKPLALNAGEVRRMQQAQSRTGRLVHEAFMYRYHPQIDRVREIVRSGELGELQLMRGSFGFRLDKPDDSRWDPALGGGALYDVGVYPLSLMRLLAGTRPQVRGAWGRLGPGGADVLAHAVLGFGDVVAHLDCGFTLPGLDVHFEAIGSRGRLRLPNPFVAKNVEAELHVCVGDEQRTERFAPVDHYMLMAAHFERAVRGEEPLRWTLDDALEQAEALDEMLARLRVS